MKPKQQSCYGQMPGAFPAEEDEENEAAYLQMMDDLAEEESNAGPQQSLSLHTTRFPGHQHQYANHNVPSEYSSYQMPASRQQGYATQAVPAKWPSHQKEAGRQHPYARPSVRAPRSHYQTPDSENRRMRQVGPIRHSGNVTNRQEFRNSQLGFDRREPPAQRQVSQVHEGYARSYPSSNGVRSSDFSRHGPSQDHFGNEHYSLPRTYPTFPLSSMPDDQTSYEGQHYGASQSRQDRQYAAYVQRCAIMHGPSPYLAASSNPHAASRAALNVAASEHGRRPETGPNNLIQPPNFQSLGKEAEKPKKSKKRAAKAEGSNEEKKPAKLRVKGQTRYENGRLQCVNDPDALVQQWEPAVRMDDCRRELIDQQNHLAAQQGMSYRDPDPVGTGMNDETAFKIEHADWGSDRAHLPGICWRFNEDEENNPRPSNKPGYMRFKGMIVLDPNDDPVIDWPQLPVTLSSKTRGYRLEIMSRDNPYLQYKDFVARMPSVVEKTKKNKETGGIEVVIEAPDPNAVCNMRMFRFRREKGMLSWTEKGNTKVIGEGLEKLFGDKLTNNSMHSFGRDLTPQEQIEIRKGKNAQFTAPNPAGGPPTQGATKKRNENAATKTVKKQTTPKVQKAPQQKRPREDDDDLDSADNQDLGSATAASYRKRRRNARGEASKPEGNINNNLSATGTTPKITSVRSRLMPYASHGYYDEDNDDILSEDQDDGEYEIGTSRRPIRPLPARRACGGAKKIHHLDPVHHQGQCHGPHGDTGPRRNATDDDTDEEMTDPDDLADGLSSEKANASVEDHVEEDVEGNTVPLKPRETDLERHRRVTREFLGEEDDFYFLPESTRQWSTLTLFPPPSNEVSYAGWPSTRPTLINDGRLTKGG